MWMNVYEIIGRCRSSDSQLDFGVDLHSELDSGFLRLF